MNRGVIYIAFGKNFVKEMLISAESVKKHNPNLHITAFIDQGVDSPFVDEVKIISAKHLRPKIDYIDQTPYEQTLFLDTDTIIDRNIEDMYDLLDNFDLAGTHDLARKRIKYSNVMPEYRDIPYAFSEINTGVLVFNSSEKVMNLWKEWRKNFYRYYNYCPWDQASFRFSLWQAIQGGLKFYVFPVEYNIRSKANREKQRKFHHEFGEEHLAPRIYHMHADTRINQGTYEIESLDEALAICKQNFMEY
tara:strand:- start:342 stop:1085 length:744 start_codon:yes stop_codon:yes gene_type:complete